MNARTFGFLEVERLVPKPLRPATPLRAESALRTTRSPPIPITFFVGGVSLPRGKKREPHRAG